MTQNPNDPITAFLKAHSQRTTEELRIIKKREQQRAAYARKLEKQNGLQPRSEDADRTDGDPS